MLLTKNWDSREIDTIVGISINGVSFAHEVARILDCEFTVLELQTMGTAGSLSNKYGQVNGQKSSHY